MIIRKEYKFYAAHRNEVLQDKCRNLHGHRYGITCHFDVERSGEYSTLFSEFDDKIDPFLKNEYDHGLLIHVEDPLFHTLTAHIERYGDTLKLKRFDFPTTVENLAYTLFSEISAMGFHLSCLEVRETDSSVGTSRSWRPSRTSLPS